MNRFTAGGIAALFGLLMSTGANAADWTGYYAGANVGGLSGKSKMTTSTVYSATGYFATTSVPAIATVGAQNVSKTGITGGIQGGYNFQSGNMVLGLELDLGAFDFSGSQTGTAVYPCCSPTNFTVTQKATTSWLFTARPRIGWSSGNWLVYGTGGLAMTNLGYQERFTDTFATALETGAVHSTRTGWTLGAGLEAQLGNNWSVKGEYLYADFGKVMTTSTNLTAYSPATAYPTNIFSHSASLTAHIFRIGLNYHL